MSADPLRECVLFFKKNSGYKRIFESLRGKYVSLGRLAGNVTIDAPSALEIQALKGFLQKDFTNQKTIKITVLQMEKALAKTKYSHLSLTEIVIAYFGGKIETKESARLHSNQAWREFWNNTLPHLHPMMLEWLQTALEKKSGPYMLLLRQYRKSPHELKHILLHVSAVLERSPDKELQPVRLAVLAAEVSGDPHYFDDKREAGRLLLYALQYKYDFHEPTNAESKNELLFQAGIIRDDISNNCTSYGLLAKVSNGGDHTGFLEFANRMEPVTASLANLWGVTAVYPKHGTNKVYIVENPTVFSVLMDAAKTWKKSISILCSNGQFRLASLIMLDMIAKNDVTMLYAGDFDPSGLLMAERMKERYGDKLCLWRFGASDYHAALSDVAVSDTELRKLEKLKTPALVELSRHIIAEHRAGYQERIIDIYLSDLGFDKPSAQVTCILNR